MNKQEKNLTVQRHLEQPAERLRLIRLCARLSGDPHAAEDLAQETLIAAWRGADRLRDAEAWRPWLSGIARNVCLRWQRSHFREQSRRATLSSGGGTAGESNFAVASARLAPSANTDGMESLAADFDLEAILERAELTALLDRALGNLTAPTRSLLMERFVDDLPPAEIAARRGLTENAAAVRLHRSKESLRRVLATAPFRADALAYGLLDADTVDGWQETRIWCPICGYARIEGRFIQNEADTGNPCTPRFAVRCPRCVGCLGMDFTTCHAALDAETLLGSIKGYKPALSRVTDWWMQRYESAIATGETACGGCGRRARATATPPPGTRADLLTVRGLYFRCDACAPRTGCVTPTGLAFHTPAVQRFWREQGRMKWLWERDVTVDGRAAVSICMGSVTGTATIETILARDTFETLRVDQVSRP